MPRLELLRHAMTRGNLRGRYIGTTDEPLAPEGIALAKANRRPPEQTPRRVWVSPLRRCQETAALLYPGAEMISVPAFRETAFGPLENKTHRELEGRPDYQRWLDSGGTAPIPGMESREEVSARAIAAFRPIAEELLSLGEEGAVVTHGGVIMALCAALGAPEEDYYRRWTPCCGGWRIDLRGWRETGKFTILAPLPVRTCSASGCAPIDEGFFRQAQPNSCRNTLCISKEFGKAVMEKDPAGGAQTDAEQVLGKEETL